MGAFQNVGVIRVDSNDIFAVPRTRARLLNNRCKQKVKKFILSRRGYKRPDFNRMILDLTRIGWTHEKIADVLPVANTSSVSGWASGVVPNYDNGDALVCLWRQETGVERFPRIGEHDYQYKIGQLDIFDDGAVDAY